jgi:chorismate mutase
MVPEVHPDLQSLRLQLRELDNELIELLCDRARIVQDIARVKAKHNIAIEDRHRESLNEDLNLKKADGRIPVGFVKDLTELLATWSKRIQSGNP